MERKKRDGRGWKGKTGEGKITKEKRWRMLMAEQGKGKRNGRERGGMGREGKKGEGKRSKERSWRI